MPGGFSYRLLRPYARFTRMEPYKNWSREELIARLQHLDPHHDRPRPQQQPQGKPFDFNAYPKRKIALKFTYNGIHYGGMEFQRDPALPTVEGVLFDALVHTKLVDRDGGLEGCDWQRCGRTDKGVSAGGQVVSLWVRSNLGSKTAAEIEEDVANAEPSTTTEQLPTSAEDAEGPGLEGDFGLMGDLADEGPTNGSMHAQPPPQAELEFPYVFALNHILPPTIRVLAWSPVADDFSARFSCRWRHYKYFFSPSGLDLAAMQDAASRLLGEHDFRNLCKIDASKQITVFTRRILHASIDRADKGELYVFNLRGNAFLYNMVRHIMAILFLVGSGLERPSIMSALLNADPARPLPPFREGEDVPPLVTGKPDYQIADPLPLMLWECGYDEGVLDWRIDRSSSRGGDSAKSPLRGMICAYERASVTTALEAHFLKAAEAHHKPPQQYFPVGAPGVEPLPPGAMMSVPLGGGMVKRAGVYVPLLQRKRMLTPDEVNERYRLGRGAKKLERKAASAAGDLDE
ncbi:tRNA pseudouridine synthase [Dichomitus squalens LYAD-421 SS1]|uniref:tRNA pseudouridine synthase n=2 Tax=Dichomitus squalens TaxID=114155 RepID=R7SST4_DICSQ|nr:tRNA pseudouridine synthase [Dichomitus squalens LYAD-421 SS1]EJF59244.1 tRNA pseudouridine synthase [Dichomitus squalens LYAD-421 SS1]